MNEWEFTLLTNFVPSRLFFLSLSFSALDIVTHVCNFLLAYQLHIFLSQNCDRKCNIISITFSILLIFQNLVATKQVSVIQFLSNKFDNTFWSCQKSGLDKSWSSFLTLNLVKLKGRERASRKCECQQADYSTSICTIRCGPFSFSWSVLTLFPLGLLIFIAHFFSYVRTGSRVRYVQPL